MKYIIYLFFILLSGNVTAQAPLLWEKSFGGSMDEGPNAIIECQDGSYLITGYTYSTDGDVSGLHGMFDIWLIKVDTSGTLVWEQTYGGSNEDNAFDLLELPDASIVLAGYTASQDGDVSFNNGGFDVWILKLDAVGNIIWEKSFGGSDDEYANGLFASADGNILVAGSTNSDDGDLNGNYGDADCWTLKLDTAGNILWQNNFGGSLDDAAFRIIETSTGKLIVSGFTLSNDSLVSGSNGLFDAWVYSLDPNGNFLYQMCIGGNSTDQANDMIYHNDKIYIIGQSSSSNGDLPGNKGSADAFTVELDTSLNIINVSNYGGSDYEFGKAITMNHNAHNIIASYSLSHDGDVGSNKGLTDVWLAEEDGLGGLNWSMSMGGSGNDYADECILDSHNSFLLAATSNSSDGDVSVNKGGYDFWILKFQGSATGIAEEAISSTMNLFPNPTQDILTLQFSAVLSGESKIIDAIGRTCHIEKFSNLEELSIDVSHLNRGIYVVQIQLSDFQLQKSFIK